MRDFQQLRPGEIVRLHYDAVNEDTFPWRHSHVDGRGVVGSFLYEDDERGWAPDDDYLYEFEGVACRGSGAEPVHFAMPKSDA